MPDGCQNLAKAVSVIVEGGTNPVSVLSYKKNKTTPHGTCIDAQPEDWCFKYAIVECGVLDVYGLADCNGWWGIKKVYEGYCGP
jgi:hypothetical protein